MKVEMNNKKIEYTDFVFVSKALSAKEEKAFSDFLETAREKAECNRKHASLPHPHIKK